MLDTDTKRRINTCRDILVGKVPDPKSQVEQITIALIYKFMDDMDLEAEEMGFERKFFVNEYERYSWSKLLAPGVSGQEMLNLYSEALLKMVENEGLPELFRNIFRNAYLPYRDPETLRSFLREINGFTYDHSERLGNAFEYLLSVLGSQGDAGQFRTPRHIIDFMVEIIDPKKDEVILDPACGTAGFLISSYKHILKANSTVQDGADGNGAEVDAAEATLDSPLRYSGDLLNTDDRERLAKNIKGYDISPDMVRLSLVNLYLHGFVDPKVEEYDTLTSEDKWGETADVILANPPFMSPKGGIKPHTKFSIASKRSEVLFVDYIAEHLTPKGRAAIVVPEGIIFQSQSAYVELRKALVEKHLAAVISLPAGVFNPYSGVKTSILVLDSAVAKKSDSVAFFKVENDGFGLGAQRKAVKGNQLPTVKSELVNWLAQASADNPIQLDTTLGFSVDRQRIAESGDYLLTVDRYREKQARLSAFPIRTLGEVAEIIAGQSPPGDSLNENHDGVPFHQGKSDFGLEWIDPPRKWTTDPQRFAKPNDILMSVRAPVGPVNLTAYEMAIGRGLAAIRPNPDLLDEKYLFRVLRTLENEIIGQSGAAFASINRSDIAAIKIPCPPLDVQQEVVAEIDGYQHVIDGARSVLEHYRTHIPINPEWQSTKLGDLCDFKNGLNFTKDEEGQPTRIVGVGDFQNNITVPANKLSSVSIQGGVGADYMLREGDILFVRSNGNPELVGRSMLVSADIGDATFSGFTIRARFNNPNCNPRFFAHFFKSGQFADRMKTVGQGANIRNLSQGILADLVVPLPSIEEQEAIIADIEGEQALIDANRELIARFETKIAAAIDRVWSAGGEAAAS